MLQALATGLHQPTGRQGNLAQFPRSVDVRAVEQVTGRAAGQLVGKAGTSDTIDATVLLLANRGDRVPTSDPGDLKHLAATARANVLVVAC